MAVGAIPLLLGIIWWFVVLPLGTSLFASPMDTFLNLGFMIYPWAAVLVYGVEVTASVCCLFFRRLRPLGAGGLTMLMLSLCAWQALIYSLMIISGGNN